MYSDVVLTVQAWNGMPLCTLLCLTLQHDKLLYESNGVIVASMNIFKEKGGWFHPERTKENSD